MRTFKTFFRLACPICGRPLFVAIELLNREASCSHCTGVFTANGAETQERHGSGKFIGDRQTTESDRGREMGFDLKRCNRNHFDTKHAELAETLSRE